LIEKYLQTQEREDSDLQNTLKIKSIAYHLIQTGVCKKRACFPVSFDGRAEKENSAQHFLRGESQILLNSLQSVTD